MKIEEQCACGSSFAVNADAGDALGAAVGWRTTHRHEAAAYNTERARRVEALAAKWEAADDAVCCEACQASVITRQGCAEDLRAALKGDA